MRKQSLIERGWAKRKKAMIAAIRLKHTLAADDEINEVLPVQHKLYFKSVQEGKEPAALAPRRAQEAAGVRS